MKNITLSVDENVLAAVRRHAAERNSTVNALVRDTDEHKGKRAIELIETINFGSSAQVLQEFFCDRGEEGVTPALRLASHGGDRAVDGVSLSNH